MGNGERGMVGRARCTRRILLDLGEVKNFAEVKVNGKAYPVLWKPPFRLDITDAVRRVEDAAPYQSAVSDGREDAPKKLCFEGNPREVRPKGPQGGARPRHAVLDLEIKVTNLWPNRLIGDEALCKPDCEWVAHPRRGQVEYSIKEIPQWVKEGKPSPTGRRTFTTWRHWTKDDALLPSGLIGPVVIRFGETAK